MKCSNTGKDPIVSFSDLMSLVAKNHILQNFRYYYVITEMGKLLISRRNRNFFGLKIF